jgi:hypothetical protein
MWVFYFFFGKDLSFFFPLYFQVAPQHVSYLFDFLLTNII